jgi:hypothetical protein
MNIAGGKVKFLQNFNSTVKLDGDFIRMCHLVILIIRDVTCSSQDLCSV